VNKISLYFHIPFCTRKCDYCHFYVLPDKDLFKSQLLEGLELEWKRWLPEIQNKEIVSVYFGGGTPALFGAKAIQTILTWIKTTLPLSAEVEITLEANPENISYDLMKAYAEAGVNRVSIGLQALDDPLLKRLGRLHSANKALDSVKRFIIGRKH
jgi:oxygen-independent coproporphyrinogen III oxidase